MTLEELQQQVDRDFKLDDTELDTESTKSEKQKINDMKKYISDLWQQRDYDNNWQTKSADLHKKKWLKALTNQPKGDIISS